MAALPCSGVSVRPATLPTRTDRTAKRGQHGQVAAVIRITQRQPEQPAEPIAHVKLSPAAGFEQRNTGESGGGLFNATVGLHGFFTPENHACCDVLKKSPSLVVEQLTEMVSG
jgi:hypothetical protein